MKFLRDDEPSYALLPEVSAPRENCYGKPIQLVDENDELAGKSLNINGNPGIGKNPDRYKQHGFYFNADNCIACHACESACSEKNNLPSHFSFRSVGYIEGGTYPDYRRLNTSMACNHCDDPVCLKGCPTRAYTKFAEYGAVLQDPNICFGCGYCTWVCPYNAPQLDPVQGHVEKCNMCVDRLEEGLKPACASACLAGALDFGVIETTPENREQVKTSLPGFPDPEITHPNIRFQQKRSLPREMTRTDAIPLRYENNGKSGDRHTPKVRKQTDRREWNLGKLRSREDPLVIFTLTSQAVIGTFLMLFLGPLFGLNELSLGTHPILQPALLFLLLGVQTFALALSTMHLGKPHRFYRAFYNLRYSPVSREVAGIAVFYNLLGAYTLLAAFPGLFGWLPPGLYASAVSIFGWGASLSGPAALYFMYRIYRIPARPFWNHWQAATDFFGNMLTLGALITALVYMVTLTLQGQGYSGLVSALALPMLAGLILQAVGLYFHARDLERRGDEGAASHHVQKTTYGFTYITRNMALAFSLLAVALLGLSGIDGAAGLAAWILTAAVIVATAIIGRALFYVLVIPTTMPGAFFWRNSGFQEHARDSGLADMPQTGVVANVH